MGVCKPRRDLGKCCCLPLAPGCYALTIWFAVYSAYNVLAIIHGEEELVWSDILAVSLVGFQFSATIVSLIGVTMRSHVIVAWAIFAWKFVALTFLVQLILLWIKWITVMTKSGGAEWDPSEWDITVIVVYTISQIFIMFAVHLLMAVHASMTAVLKAGGSGWEGLSAVELGAGKRSVTHDDEDDDDEKDDDIAITI